MLQKKQSLFVYFLIGMVVLLGVGWLMRMFVANTNNMPPTIDSNFNDSTSTFDNVIYVGEPYTPPPILTISTAMTALAPIEPVIDDIVAKGKMVPNAYSPNIWDGPTATLMLLPENHQLAYATTRQTEYDPSSSDFSLQPFGENEPIPIAEDFLKQFESMSAFQVWPEGIEYFLGSEDYQPKAKEDANTASIPFVLSHHNLPVQIFNNSTPPVVITVNSDLEVTDAKIAPISITETAATEQPSISIQQAVKNINNNNAIVTNASTNAVIPVEISTIKKGELKTVRLEYRLPSLTQGEQTLMPYYRFSGTITNSAGEEYRADIITPAVATSR